MSHLLFAFSSELSRTALECILREWSLITRGEGRASKFRGRAKIFGLPFGEG